MDFPWTSTYLKTSALAITHILTVDCMSYTLGMHHANPQLFSQEHAS